VFESEAAATTANELAVTWAKERLASLGAAPLDASQGVVLVHTCFDRGSGTRLGAVDGESSRNVRPRSP
jgi:hypothetical protein